jgi:hypothetical protein
MKAFLKQYYLYRVNILKTPKDFNFLNDLKNQHTSPKVLAYVKKNPYIINQNPIFFQKNIVKSFLERFNKFYIKTFGIVYILNLLGRLRPTSSKIEKMVCYRIVIRSYNLVHEQFCRV